MSVYARLLSELRAEPRRWLITGCAGFIGSHLLETLLRLDQVVAGLDNFSTGSPRILDEVRTHVTEEQWSRFTFHQGSVREIGICREASNYADYVLHQGGFVSVPLSVEDPVGCHDANVTGTMNVLVAARDNRVRRVVYASSSSVYGDDGTMPKVEAQIGRPLSPYAASKQMAEIYARLFTDTYGLETTGLRYFNIFGPRQNPHGGYAAVIPQWISTLVHGGECTIFGDGSATRDFCPVANVVQANLLAATMRSAVRDGVYNIALGGSTTVRELYELISTKLAAMGAVQPRPVQFEPERHGDIQHSAADISAAQRELGYIPEVDLNQGLEEMTRTYAAKP